MTANQIRYHLRTEALKMENAGADYGAGSDPSDHAHGAQLITAAKALRELAECSEQTVLRFRDILIAA